MPNVVVRYRTKPERAEENQKLVQEVFAALDALGDIGFGYACLRLEDGVSFVHVVVEDEEATDRVSLTDVPAFQAFVAGIADRCDEPPARHGSHRRGQPPPLPRHRGLIERVADDRQHSGRDESVRASVLHRSERSSLVAVT